MSSPRKPRGPGVVFAVLTIVLIVLIGVVALTDRQPPPPTIAEFAPSAVEQITDVQTDQTGRVGRGAGPGQGDGVGGDDGGGAGAAVQSTINVPRVRRCVGDPPRQVEDPQSPPCVPYWEGDNGGATWKGVTRDEIRIVVPDSGDEDPRYQSFFNKRFEFYGRQMVLIPGRDDQGADPAQQRAAAVLADEEHHVFATTNSTFGGGFQYYDELARRGIVSGIEDGYLPESYLGSGRPYLWQYTMGTDDMFANTGEWACKRLAGRPAVHAGSPVFIGRTRTFGIILGKHSPDVPVSSEALERELGMCGVKAVEHAELEAGDAAGAGNAAVTMNAAGATTTFCLCDVRDAGAVEAASSGQGYYPEWLLGTYIRADRNFGFRFWQYPKEQLAHTFGLTFQPRQISPVEEPQYWATKEIDPGAQAVSSDLGIWNINVKYRSLLLLASGIQMAGPQLTPSTFESGLQRAKFPNPEHPNLPGKVGFGAEGGTPDHTMTNDGAEWWYSNTAPSPYDEEGPGTVCYVDGGVRHRKGAWPSGGDPFFDGNCITGAS